MVQSVALLGVDGKLGPSVMRALVSNGFNVTVLKRASSKSPSSYPHTVVIPDDFPVDVVAQALRGKDAVVVTIKGSETALQKRIADACVRAGVKRKAHVEEHTWNAPQLTDSPGFIPADFGSCDSASPLTQETVPLYRNKTELREYLMQLAEANESFSWTSIVCGHFFDWSLEFLHIWLDERRAEVLDDGEVKWSLSTLSQIAEATARVLQRPAVTKNKMIYIQSFLVSQNEVLHAFEQATGSKWNVKTYDSQQYLADEKKKADGGDLEAVENLVWLLGTIDANWELRGDAFAMAALGLTNEDLQATVKKIVSNV